MNIIEVNNSETAHKFLLLPSQLYQLDDNWIQPFNHDIENVFDENKNKFFRHGVCKRWILLNDDQIVIGRIAAFINHRTADENKTGGIGFFECIDSSESARLLFDTAIAWLKEQCIEAVEGPINFGEKDKWWGLLVNGFTQPTYSMNYNPPYYQKLFEGYGFKTYYEQYVYAYKIGTPVPEKYTERANKIALDKAYSFRHIEKKRLKEFTTYFHEVYNAAWVKHHGFKPMRIEQAIKIIQAIKPIMDEKLIWFGFYNNKPIAFFIMIPDINQVLRKMKGTLNWYDKLVFLFHLKFTKTVTKCIGLVFGVVPEFQGMGVEGGLIKAAESQIAHWKYTDLEMNWIASFNPKMIAICESLGTEKVKTLITYKYNFDEKIPVKPHPIIK